MEWRKIKCFKNYSVSRDGEIRNNNTKRILKKYKGKDGYEYVTLCENGEIKRLLVHRLVAEAFIPNPENKPCVDHINTIRDDNSVENLHWCTYEQNNNNPLTLEKMSKAKKGKILSKEHKQKLSKAKKNKYKGENHPMWNKGRKIICITTGKIYESTHEAERQTGVAYQSIVACCKGRIKSAGKHTVTGEKLVWRYLEQ